MAEENKSSPSIGAKAAKAGAHAALNSIAKKKLGSNLTKVLVVKGISIFLVIALLLMPILFLFALPVMMFEALMTFIDTLNDVFSDAAYELSAGVNFLTAMKNAAKGVIDATVGKAMDWLGNAWASFKSFLFGDSQKKTDEGYSDLDEEYMGDAASEIKITQSENDEKATLMDSLRMTQDAYNNRTAAMEESILGGDLHNAVVAAASADYQANYSGHDYVSAHTKERDAYESREEALADTAKDYYTYDLPTVSVNAGKLSDMDAARIMSIYSVTKGSSLQNMNLSDYQKWLGYNPGYVGAWWPWNKANCTVPVDVGLGDDNPRVERWIGFCLPQYLQDQVMYEQSTFGGTLCGAYGSQSCAAIDMCIVVDAPPLTSLVPTIQEETIVETRWYKTTETPEPEGVSVRTDNGPQLQTLSVHINEDVGGGGTASEPTPSPEPVEVTKSEEFTFTIHHVSYHYSVTISPRDPEDILSILGFTGTEFALDVNAGGGIVPGSMFTNPATGGGELPEEATQDAGIEPEQNEEEIPPAA